MFLDAKDSALWDGDVAKQENAILKDKLAAAEKRLEAMEYVIAYANDIVETWPTITMRTLWKMTEKVATIKEALRQAL